MSNNVICLGGRARTLAPLFPRVVTTKPALESLDSDFRTNVGFAFTLSARSAEPASPPGQTPSAAMMCVATANWTLFADIGASLQYVMLRVTFGCGLFCARLKCRRGRKAHPVFKTCGDLRSLLP